MWVVATYQGEVLDTALVYVLLQVISRLPFPSVGPSLHLDLVSGTGWPPNRHFQSDWIG
jgi:hypothetical protein